MRRLRLAMCTAIGALAACSDTGDATGPDAAAEAARDAGAPNAAPDAQVVPDAAGGSLGSYPQALAAVQLELRSEPCGRRTLGGGGGDAECLTTRVPLSWREPDRGEIELFVKRLPAPERTGRQLWLLQGGPGIPGFIAEEPAEALQQALPDADVFIVDYRGVGRSQLLDCPSVPGLLPFDPRDEQWPVRAERCFEQAYQQWGDDIYSFNVTETAVDIAALIEATRAAELPVHVYAWSWGTHVAHAMLRVVPDALDGVVLDSFLAPGPQPDSDEGIDRVARQVLQACQRDADCAARFEGPPEDFAQALIGRLRQGHCPQLAERGIDVEAFQLMLGLAVTVQAELGLLPALLYRADRCSDDDVAALVAFRGAGGGNNLDLLPVKLSPVVQLLQLRPLTRDQSAQEVRARYDSRLALTGLELRSAWIRQAVPAGPAGAIEDGDTWASPQGPLLVLQGGLDSVTPPRGAAAARQHFGAPQHWFVEVDNAAHALLRQLPCTAQVVAPWMRRPRDAPGLGCLQALSIDFSAGQERALSRLGRSDAWD